MPYGFKPQGFVRMSHEAIFRRASIRPARMHSSKVSQEFESICHVYCCGNECMTTAKKNDYSSSGISDWLLELGIGLAVVVLVSGAWAYTYFVSPNIDPSRPVPVWLAVPKVMAQTADGRMVNVKVNLQLAKADDVSLLEPHVPAFKTLIQDVSTDISRDELKQPDGILQFGQAVKATFNSYLKSQDVSARVKNVAFDELMPLP